MNFEKKISKALFLILLLILVSCHKENKTDYNPVRNVILTEIETSGETSSKNYSGVVEEGKSVNAAFMTGGKLLTTKVKEGDRVRKGQLLATLDDEDYRIGVNQLRVQYEQMTAEKQRMDEMFARHNVAPNDYEKFEAGYEQLRLQLEMANNKLGYTKLYSPSDGFVSFKYMQPGELVDAGTPIYKITDDTKLEVSVDLPLSVYLNRNEIKETYGFAPNLKEKMPLKIESFTPDADNNQLYHMKLDIPSSYRNDLTTGMNITVELEMLNDYKGESLIPSRAIFNENGKTYVWIFNSSDSVIHKHQVFVEGQPQNNKSIVTGLNGNEKIVSAGVKQLKQGEKVNVISNPIHTDTK